MKRYGHLYERICDLDNIMQAHRSARRGKAHYREVQAVDQDPLPHVKSIRNMLLAHEYRTSPYKVFYKWDGGKEREIYVLPYYPDRIVQWAAVQVLEPIWERTLISHTYSSLKGRGIHKGLVDLHRALRDVEGTRYCLKLDVRKFYPSIDHAILKATIRHSIKDAEVLELLDSIIDSLPNGKGVPIGNYLSQYFGNLYLSSMDHWIKEEKGVRYYFRYCDDMVVLGPDKAELHQLKGEMESYLRDNLKLALKDNWQVFPVDARGIDFLGYRSFHGRTLLRERTACRMKKRMMGIIECGTLDDTVRSTVASYRGWLKWCDAAALEQKYIGPVAAMEEIL